MQLSKRELDALAENIISRRRGAATRRSQLDAHALNIIGLVRRGLKPYEVARTLKTVRPPVHSSGTAIRGWLKRTGLDREGNIVDPGVVPKDLLAALQKDAGTPGDTPLEEGQIRMNKS